MMPFLLQITNNVMPLVVLYLRLQDLYQLMIIENVYYNSKTHFSPCSLLIVYIVICKKKGLFIATK